MREYREKKEAQHKKKLKLESDMEETILQEKNVISELIMIMNEKKQYYRKYHIKDYDVLKFSSQLQVPANAPTALLHLQQNQQNQSSANNNL